jgi:hypothetical protein
MYIYLERAGSSIRCPAYCNPESQQRFLKENVSAMPFQMRGGFVVNYLLGCGIGSPCLAIPCEVIGSFCMAILRLMNIPYILGQSSTCLHTI